ncbi:protein involved in gliding motility GldA [Bernardetia litoralis DSM 6794]|uniref:Protein involved in gliding motility GldA n=1 Tax=Bernardetia litoralis (strain ATCC 23117 / DSM 6794 / NBRC 15988 / NCIMB 1366 / Fx l1 / Sio-4) TaxID=880071 RepID=I4APU0_BERLS|nr:gliding motility-associated ABC transporter ATP-binding subunit GldA [Bernardetia litoralis]AFM05975.1 protein involved in gliding motility GldA [Bernardetia litoralis DSM 6794]
MIKINNLTKIYGSQAAVDNLSFEAQKGEILGFLGPNGAGKSTTMKIATCYMAASSGNIEVCGIDVAQNPKEVRKKIGYLPEHNPLYLDMYVKEYLAFMGKFYDLKGVSLKNRIDEVIELVKLERESHKQLHQLSKGYRQRVGLAQALLHNPEVLILDEPTTGLDPNQIVEIRQVIKSISKEKIIIFSTHIMQEVQALCDRVVIINKGKKVLDVSIDQLNDKLKTELGQLNQNEYIVNIETEKPVLEEEWKQIEGIIKVEINQIEPKKVKLFTQTDLRKEIFLHSAQNNWILLEMQQQTQSLENVFHQLTK